MYVFAAAVVAVTLPPLSSRQEEQQAVDPPQLAKYRREDANIHRTVSLMQDTLGLPKECVSFRLVLPGFVFLTDPYKYGCVKNFEPPVRFPLHNQMKFYCIFSAP